MPERLIDHAITLGEAAQVCELFRGGVAIKFELDAAASAEQLATLRRLTERYCVVYQTLRQAPAISVSLNGEIAQ